MNGNRTVNGSDLVRVFFAMFWPYNQRYDINRDGVVNLYDFWATARQWGRRCSGSTSNSGTGLTLKAPFLGGRGLSLF